MQQLHKGGVVLTVLFLVGFVIFGAGGSANAEDPPVIPVWLYFVAEAGDNCWDLAIEYRGEGQFCEEMLLVNQHIEFAEDGVPIIVKGTSYWLHPRWTQSQGDHVLYESIEHMIVAQPIMSFIDTDPIGFGNLGTFQRDSQHDCSGWWPKDPHCDGGNKTIGALLITAVVTLGIVWYIRRRKNPHWPLS